jgi:penicillin-binding protein 1A
MAPMSDSEPPLTPTSDADGGDDGWNARTPVTRAVLPSPPRSKFQQFVRWAGFATSVGAVMGMLVFLGGYTLYARDLPAFASVDDYEPKLATRVYSVDGRLIGEFGTERRRLVPYERIPKRLIQAFIATEDGHFFDHGGIYYPGIVRAIVFKLIGKSERIGGTSTVTQQLAKSLLVLHYQRQFGDKEGYRLGTERSIRRKAKEMILARRLEANLTKEEILWLYLNQTFLGHGAYGVQAAAEHYFRKDVEELTLPEMALLAGLPQAPSRYSPLRDAKAARARVNTVLARMEANGFITSQERKEAVAVDLKEIVKPRDDRFRDTAPYFTEHVRRYIYDTYGEKALYEGGLRIDTTLDLERQHHAESAMVNGLRLVDKRQGYRGPIATIRDRSKWPAVVETLQKKWIANDDEVGKNLVRGKPYLALVTKVDRKHQWAEVKVGETDGLIPLAGMRWAREPNPNKRWTRDLVEDVRDVVKVGDVVLVERRTRKELWEAAMDNDIAKMMPKKEKGARVDPDPNKPLPPWARPFFSLEQVPVVEGALIAMNPHTGYVEAMIGGYAFEDSEFNRAFQACRQPGSVFKPIVYSAAVVREDYTPATMILDTPIIVRDTDIGKSWKPKNFEHTYKGEVTCREALMHSMNVPALKTAETVGVKNFVNFAHKMGIKTQLKEELGTAIGSSCVTLWELTHVYTTWARGGLRPEPVFIKRINDRHGNVLEDRSSPNDPWQNHDQRLDALYRKLNAPPIRVLDEVDAYLVNYLLTQVAKDGTAARASRLRKPVAGKTGTTNDSFDTWFAGYTPSLVATVWVGYDTYDQPLSSGEQGGRTALPIWLNFMKGALADKEEPDWPMPEGVCNARVDPRTGNRVFEDTPGSFIAPFRCGTEPKAAPVAGLSIEDAIKAGGI